MFTSKVVTLKAGKERPLQRFHPWVFSGALLSASPDLEDGDLALVQSHRGEPLAYGHYFKGNIALRILSFDPSIAIDAHFWEQKIQKALNKRIACGYCTLETFHENAFRLIHGEGDGLPGLIIDNYNGNLVIQVHTDGMQKNFGDVVEALKTVLGSSLKSVFSKSESTHKGSDIANHQVYGIPAAGTIISENKVKFEVNWQEGQKTGFFLDQRDNRFLLQSLARDKSVLNTFCYTGGFSMHALAGGAQRVTSVDISAKAIELTEYNLKLNDFDSNKHQAICADVMHWMKTCEETYDVVILDPPAFAKNIKSRHSAVQAYKRLNLWGLNAVKSGGLLFTFSCSQVVDNALFEHTVIAAAIESGKEVSILRRLGQSTDHPVSAFHPEGSYLKGLLLYIA